MTAATQTFGLPLYRVNLQRGASFAAIGARLWLSLVAKIKANHAAAAEARDEQELLALAARHEQSFPSFAADLRAANCRRSYAAELRAADGHQT